MIKLFGIEIQNTTKKKFFEKIDTKLENENKNTLFIVTMNPEIALFAKENKEYSNILKEACVVVDGFGIKLVKMIRDRITVERIVGVDICDHVIKKASAENKELLIVMKDDGFSSNDEVRSVFKKKYQIHNLRIITNQDYIKNPEMYENAQVLLVSLGAPNQERFINRYLKNASNTEIAIGVGGTFDYWTGKKKRAPKIFQKMGLEWLWRFSIQPNRARRIFNAIIIFPFYALTEKYEK